jgi:hypothetical protein
MVLTLNSPARVSHSYCRDHLFIGQTGDSATLLLDRTVLLICGFDGSGELMSALQRFVFASGRFNALEESALPPRRGHMATCFWVSASL